MSDLSVEHGDHAQPMSAMADHWPSNDGGQGDLAELLDELIDRGARDRQRLMGAALLAVDVAVQLGLDTTEVEVVRQVALLQDVGRLDLPAALFGDSAQLDRRIRRQLCAVPLRGEARVRDLPGLAHLAPMVRAQHERWDGSGYPDGLAGEQIPLPSRIALLCDAYHAMGEPRPDRPALDPQEIREVLHLNAGRQFCPDCTAGLLEVLDRRPATPTAAPDGTPDRPDAPAPADSEQDNAERDNNEQKISEQAATTRALLASTQADGTDTPGPTPPPAADPPRKPGRPSPRRRAGRPRRLVRTSAAWFALAGLLGGLLVALPVPDVHGRCPAAGEGLSYCALQKVWFRSLTVVITGVIAGLVVHWLIFHAPTRLRAWRAWRARAAPPPFDEDPVLVAANWGLTYDDAHPRRRSWKHTQAG